MLILTNNWLLTTMLLKLRSKTYIDRWLILQWNTFFVPIQSLYTSFDNAGFGMDHRHWGTTWFVHMIDVRIMEWESLLWDIQSINAWWVLYWCIEHCLPTSYEQGFSNDSLTPISGILVISLFSKDNTATFTGWYVMWHVLVILHCNDMVTLALYLDWLPATTICSWVDHLLYHCYGFYFEDW